MKSIPYIVRRINDLLEWEPHNLFHTTSCKWRQYSEPRVEGGLFEGISTHSGTFDTHYHYTKLGEWLNDDAPMIIDIAIKLPYYIISWPIYLAIKLVWGTLKLFFPQRWYS